MNRASDRTSLGALGIVAAIAAAALGLVIFRLVLRLRATNEALWDLARRDELTGVGNYRALHERLEEEIARHGRHGREFGLVLIDLDGFKDVNELHGHLHGDRLLAEVGAALRDEVRREDSVFRQGGDEFAVIVPEANAEETAQVAGRLRDRIARRRYGSDERFPISAATGYAMYPSDGATVEELFACADRDLFAAKRSAR